MSVIIKELRGRSGVLRAGDEIVAVGGRKVRDQLDLFFITASEGSAEFHIRRKDGRELRRRLRFETFENALPVFEEMEFKCCRSRCIFCFVDQMPPAMRPSLYNKDDDYRLSFLYGNFVTLNDVEDEDLDRIIEYNLSPLYISVHATGKTARRKIFGRPMKRDLLEDLRKLSDNGIMFNAQIVLVPGVNDGRILEKTVSDLRNLHPACKTLAIVPVGLTRHRKGLDKIKAVSADEAKKLIEWSRNKSEGYGQFLQLADEFFLKAGFDLPDYDYYGDFDQLANGVGMCRLFLHDLENDAGLIRPGTSGKLEMTLVTGKTGERFFRKYVIPLLDKILPGMSLGVLKVSNTVFGADVTVSGLLSGKDIMDAIRSYKPATDCVILPANCVNHEGVMIDGMRPEDIEEETGKRILIPENTFLEKGIIIACRQGGIR